MTFIFNKTFIEIKNFNLIPVCTIMLPTCGHVYWMKIPKSFIFKLQPTKLQSQLKIPLLYRYKCNPLYFRHTNNKICGVIIKWIYIEQKVGKNNFIVIVSKYDVLDLYSYKYSQWPFKLGALLITQGGMWKRPLYS